MADEELAADTPLEGADAPAEIIEDTPPETLETIAADLGWSPKENWRGDEAKWKPAADFIRDTGKINRDLSRTVRDLSGQISGISRVTETIVADKIAERDQYWAGKHREAVEAGDVDAAEQAATERAKVRTERPVAATPPETASFVERNASWFQKNPLATRRAFEVTEALAKDGYSVADQLAEAERRVKIEYPDLFPTPAKPPASVASPTSRAATSTKRDKGFESIPSAAQTVLKQFGEKNNIPLDRLAKSYWADQAKLEKVG